MHPALRSPAGARAAGLAAGVLADALFGDPRRGHPVAGFGRAASTLERRLYRDDVLRGGWFAALACGPPVLAGVWLERRPSPWWGRAALTAAATWTVLGGAGLAGEGRQMAALLADAERTGDLTAARARLCHLCARDASRMSVRDLARATVESLAENSSDAVVAPLLWGAVAGVPGLLGYRAANTLDAMVGYRSERYLRFGRAAARLDDAVNLVPARVAGLLTAVAARSVGGSPRAALAVLRRDGGAHPSPNAGRPEAAAAGALGVRLGGANTYHGVVEQRPVLGAEGRDVVVADVARAVRLGRVVTGLAAALAVVVAAGRAGAVTVVTAGRSAAPAGARSGPRPAAVQT